MNNKKLFISLLAIVLLGLLLRFIGINKPEGMWNDEYLTWEIAKASFPKEFFEAIIRNCHAPLHYIYLKVWMHFFGETDFSLRLSSLFPGVLSIVAIFFAAKSLNKKNSDIVAIAAAGLCAISSFLIYFSQEVRIYSLLFLLATLNVWCAIKTLDLPSKKNCTFFVITSLLVMLEHTIGFVFVFFSSVALILFADKKKKFKKFLVTSLFLGLVIFIPVGIFLYNTMFNQQYFSQWWAPFSWAKLAFFFTDLFSPHIVNITNAPPSFWAMAYDGSNVNFGFILFAVIPLAIALGCILKAILSDFDKNVKYFLFVFLGVYLTVFAASVFGKIVFLTKYMIEVYPPLILLASIGFAAFKGKNFRVVLATSYIVLCLFFILVSEYSPVKLVRSEGQNIPVVLLKRLDYGNRDKLLFLYYPKERFSKYLPALRHDNNAFHISKYDFLLIKDSEEKMKDVYKNGKTTYQDVFLAEQNSPLDSFLNKNIFSKMDKGDRFFLVDFLPVTFFSPEGFQRIVRNEKKYDKTPFLYLVFSYIKNYIVKEASSRLAYEGMLNIESWAVYVFRKT